MKQYNNLWTNEKLLLIYYYLFITKSNIHKLIFVLNIFIELLVVMLTNV